MNQLNAILVGREDVSPGHAVFRVAPDGWSLPPFVAGQFGLLGLPGDAPRCAEADADEEPRPAPDALIRRTYSAASSSFERRYVEFFVSLVRTGALTPRLFALRPGDRLHLGARFSGMFTLAEVPADQHVAMVATGTGLAPYMSMLRSRAAANPDRRIAVLLGARRARDLGFLAELEALAEREPNVVFAPIVSRPQDEDGPWSGRVGRVQNLWTGGALSGEWGFAARPGAAHVFLCGNPRMVEEMSELLRAEGFKDHSRRSPGDLHAERFW